MLYATVLRCAVITTLLLLNGLSFSAFASTIFEDSFDRPDGPVGNGWVVVEENVKGGLPIIKDKRLTGIYNESIYYSYFHRPTIKRDLRFSSAVEVSVDLTPGSTNGVPGQYNVGIGLGYDEAAQYPNFSGLQLIFGRQDSGSISGISLYYNGISVAGVVSALSFGESVRLNVKFDLARNTVSGILFGNGQVFEFSIPFTPQGPIAQNVYLALGPGLYDAAPAPLYATADNIKVISHDSPPGKIIYVGVCGVGAVITEPCVGGDDWYDPRHQPLLTAFNPLNEAQLESVAYYFSGLDAIALRIARLHPTSVTAIRGFNVANFFGNVAKGKVVAAFIQAAYTPGDRIFLVGHSGGGAIIQEAAYVLGAAKIPVEMTAQIDSVGTGPDAKVAPTVQRAFNFYFPWNFAYDSCLVFGETTLVTKSKKNPTGTIVSNQSIDSPKPVGPDSVGSSCAGHKNMDNDPRVWRPILKFMGG